MKGIPVTELNNRLGEILSNLEGSFQYDHQIPIRCDQCSQVIHPNTTCGVYFTDRLLHEPPTTTQFRLIRIECDECCPYKFIYDAPEFSEMLLSGRFDPDYILRDIHIVCKSSRSEGFEWEVDKLYDAYNVTDEAIDTSPVDLMRIISLEFDPRDLIDSDTGEFLVADDEIELFRYTYALSAADKEPSKDELRALKQTYDSDITEEQIEKEIKFINSKMKDKIRKIIEFK